MGCLIARQDRIELIGTGSGLALFLNSVDVLLVRHG